MGSQLGQDDWVISKYRSGFFVEVGAYDGVTNSNTLKLEQAGWKGICVEPDPMNYRALTGNRRCPCFNVAVLDQTGLEVEFRSDAKGHSGITKHLHCSEAFDSSAVILVPTVSLNDLLEKANAPREITYVSIDTEGSEIEIVRAFDFDRWSVACWTIEHNDYLRGNNDRSEELKRIFAGRGYEHVVVEQDVWFSRSEQ